jgi:hypothetical protein
VLDGTDRRADALCLSNLSSEMQTLSSIDVCHRQACAMHSQGAAQLGLRRWQPLAVDPAPSAR